MEQTCIEFGNGKSLPKWKKLTESEGDGFYKRLQTFAYQNESERISEEINPHKPLPK